jgi:hypothetical protein
MTEYSYILSTIQMRQNYSTMQSYSIQSNNEYISSSEPSFEPIISPTFEPSFRSSQPYLIKNTTKTLETVETLSLNILGLLAILIFPPLILYVYSKFKINNK